MKNMQAATVLGLASLAGLAAASSEELPHDHQGKLSKYELGPPKIFLSGDDLAQLREGRPVMQAAQQAGSSARRMVMVQDIKTPHDVVMGCAAPRSFPPIPAPPRRTPQPPNSHRLSPAPSPHRALTPRARRILDFEKYDQMVSGVNHCANYAQCDDGGLRTIKSAYQIQALHMKFNYFMEHTYDPAQQCLTFHLDYDRKSDLDDSVGYWYVQPTSPDACRVYYSCECKLRGWVPGPVYDMLTKKALQRATTWVSAGWLKEWDGARQPAAGNGMVRFVGAMRGRSTAPPTGCRCCAGCGRRATRCAGSTRGGATPSFVSSPRLVHSSVVGRLVLPQRRDPGRGLCEEGRGGSAGYLVPCR